MIERSRWAAAGAAVLLAAGGPASAHYVYQGQDVYDSESYCTRVRSEVSHGSVNNGYARVDVTSRYLASTPMGDARCGWNKSRVSGQIAAAYDWYVSKRGETYLCAWTDWQYSSTKTHKFVISYHFPTTMCGSGYYYGTMGWGYVQSNGGWRGGSLFSGWHGF